MSLRTPTATPPAVGTPVEEVPTPAVVVDLDTMDRNLAEYHDAVAAHGVRLRPHTKTHKTPALAHRQTAFPNARGVACQTLSEAEVLAHGGHDDVYLSYMVVAPEKCDRLVRLAESIGSFATTVDGPGNVEPLAAAAADRDTVVDVVLEVDVGMGRVGAASVEDAVALAEDVAGRPSLRVAGLMTYEGHVAYGPESPTTAEGFEAACLDAMDDVAAVVDAVEDAGVAVPEVKVGSTPTSRYSCRHDVVDEVNPGMYAFNDRRLVEATPDVEPADCALTVLSTVISAPADDRAVVDAGSKSICPDVDLRPLSRRDGLTYHDASEEHGWLRVDDDVDVAVGDRVGFVPPHVCSTVNLHDALVGVRDGEVADVWTVQGRGHVQ